MKFEHVSYDWKLGGCEKKWEQALNKLGLHLVEDPVYEGTDTYGFFICNQEVGEDELKKMVQATHSPEAYEFMYE